MAKLYTDTDKFGDANASPTVEAFHAAVKDIVRQKLAESGGHWDSFVFDKSYTLITEEDMKGVEKMLLDAGHLFDWSAAISPTERPEAYKPVEGVSDDDMGEFSFEHEDAVTAAAEGGLEQRGQGDNVARYAEDCEGVARYIRSPMQVMKFLEEGVPDNTIAIIDDSGGTLTAPILEQFKGVICAGGTTRSHLGILTREYGVPCVMNAKVSGIKQGDTVRIESTGDPKTAADYQKNVERTVKVWRVAGAS
ncbi:PEP-utilizing enzyme [Pseudooceanicola atlanticus]|uniref:PEP-utilising enzyme mobile domain-containing protein n=1 Tax=Pseudooceanicola atlanticus TaxID=1461694 RepID=A0A0A0EEX7_9RHOB|nr:PEP-utilizing enzyme [Pseudooceanicola atlanticus]KGM48944.1 hypothetical protein ATO9_09595 [Pseudooceanicola atlanticus]